MADKPLRLLVFGAHPDDPDFAAGGIAAKYRQLGHSVRFVSVTNGASGHHQMSPEQLALRRRAEARTAGNTLGIDYDVWDNPDGELEPSLEVRRQVIRLIRQFQPDLLLTHRPNDYHPDHRYSSMLVQDAAYMVTVPHICPDVRHLERDPVIMYVADRFEKPYPFAPTVIVDIEEVWQKKLEMLHCHTSQMYEWLPYNSGRLDEVPGSETDRRAWLAEWLNGRKVSADRYRELLIELYGSRRGSQIQYIEALEICEYGCQPDRKFYARLFPFVPAFQLNRDPTETVEKADCPRHI